MNFLMTVALVSGGLPAGETVLGIHSAPRMDGMIAGGGRFCAFMQIKT